MATPTDVATRTVLSHQPPKRAALAPIAPDAEHVYPGDTHQVLPEMVEDLAPFLREHLV